MNATLVRKRWCHVVEKILKAFDLTLAQELVGHKQPQAYFHVN